MHKIKVKAINTRATRQRRRAVSTHGAPHGTDDGRPAAARAARGQRTAQQRAAHSLLIVAPGRGPCAARLRQHIRRGAHTGQAQHSHRITIHKPPVCALALASDITRALSRRSLCPSIVHSKSQSVRLLRATRRPPRCRPARATWIVVGGGWASYAAYDALSTSPDCRATLLQASRKAAVGLAAGGLNRVPLAGRPLKARRPAQDESCPRSLLSPLSLSLARSLARPICASARRFSRGARVHPGLVRTEVPAHL